MTRKAVESFTNPLRKVRGLQSPTDKLLHQTTISILVFLFLLLASKPFFGTPISCQVPKDWVGDEYFHDICYFGQREKSSHIKIINRGNKQGTMELNTLTGTSEFYMWVPVIPILHVALSLLPVFFWKFIGLGSFSGLDINTFMEFFETEPGELFGMQSDLVNVENWRCHKLAAQFHKWVKTKRETVCGLSRTLFLYVMMKWFRFAVFVLQFWIIAHLFGGGNLYWGYENIITIAQGNSMNPLEGEFTLLTGCRVQKWQLGVSPAPGRRVPYSNVYTTIVKCVLSSNFINAKAFLFLYCWFLFVSVVSFCSALHHTIILCVPTYRKYKISSMIRTEEYFIRRCGEPHHDLNLGEASPIEYFINYLGNDGYLIVQMVHDMMRHYSCDRFIEYVWEFVVVHNAQEIHFSKVPDKDVPHTKLSGAGDRYHGGKDLPKKKKRSFSSSTEPRDTTSLSKFSLTKESQPSLLLSESDEEPLISPSIFNSLSP